MRKAQSWIFLALITCHFSLYLIAWSEWELPRSGLWREFWWQVWGVSLAPALLAGYRFGVPAVVEPIRNAIFLPVLEPSTLGYFFCLLVWCAVYGFLSYAVFSTFQSAARRLAATS